MGTSPDDKLLKSLEATVLVFRMEIRMAALPSGRAVVGVLSGRGEENSSTQPGRLGGVIHRTRFHWPPFKALSLKAGVG